MPAPPSIGNGLFTTTLDEPNRFSEVCPCGWDIFVRELPRGMTLAQAIQAHRDVECPLQDSVVAAPGRLSLLR